VPTFNSADQIHACLLSVRRWLPDAEVVVVDNGSTDKTCEMVREAFPEVVLIAGHGNVGFGRACNLGADRASNAYVLYLNPDAELALVDQDALVALMQSRPLGIVGGMLIEEDGAVHPTMWRRYRHWLTQFVAVHLLAVLSPYAPRTRFVERAEVQGAYTVSGSIFLVAVDEFRSLGSGSSCTSRTPTSLSAI
jgi:GT2 family glycosyltransferase